MLELGQVFKAIKKQRQKPEPQPEPMDSMDREALIARVTNAYDNRRDERQREKTQRIGY